jgi:hypothetical protein
MKGAVQRWVTAVFVGSSICLVAISAPADDATVQVTDADRVFRNFTRETSTVPAGQLRVEVRGMHLQDETDAQLNIAGLKVDGIGDLTGGTLDLLLSYGFMENAEAGFIIPAIIEKRDPREDIVASLDELLGDKQGEKDALLQELTDAGATEEGFGDLLFYTKFQHRVAEHTSLGAGAEFTMPSGSESKKFGTGEFGANPFVSARYQQGRIGVGGHLGYNFYTGDAREVFNYSAHAIVRASQTYALRAEWSGRVFHQGGVRYHDSVVMPGIDFNLSNTITIRPVGLAHLTGPAMDYGLGIGVAGIF